MFIEAHSLSHDKRITVNMNNVTDYREFKDPDTKTVGVALHFVGGYILRIKCTKHNLDQKVTPMRMP